MTTSPPEFAALVDKATEAAVRGTEPFLIGTHGKTVVVPPGYDVRTIDERVWEDTPRHVAQAHTFTDVPSLAYYCGRFDLSAARCYVKNPASVGEVNLLCHPVNIADVVIDDHTRDAADRRTHHAALALVPTTAATRWGNALAATLGQEGLVELVTDGVAEIVAPDAADLRDLISDLQASTSTTARSVVRANGETAIEFAEKVQLHAGTGNRVTVPDSIDVAFQPFVGHDVVVGTVLRLRPRVRGDQVSFTLRAPALLDELLRRVRQIVDEVGAAVTDLPEPPLWTL